MNQVLIQQITSALKNAKEKGLTFRELSLICNVHPRQTREFRECLRYLESKNLVIDRTFKIYHAAYMKLSIGTVTRLMKTFGFVRLNEEQTEVFIPGKFFMGAMPGDTVMVAPIESRGTSPEGEITKIIKEGDAQFSAVLGQDEDGFFIIPDSVIRFNIRMEKDDIGDAKVGDKVCCKITERGSRHSEHKAKVVAAYGDAQTAKNCAQALLDVNNVSNDFPPDVKADAIAINNAGIDKAEMDKRIDLRDELIFTIDGADTKDIDDAVSLSKQADCYKLGVHIADVSHYVKADAPIDEEAYKRGTSIYFADRVIPMLPPELSNGICSLNPKEDRLAFSCLMTISLDGKLMDYDFKKSVICSKAKGVYSEINQILAHTESDEIKAKYDGLYASINLMQELANILTKNKIERGAPEIETNESYVVLDENGITVDIVPRTRGESEVMIEEFMLMANQAAASAATKAKVPFIYRVHEAPSEEKIETLHTILTTLGIECKDVVPGMQAITMAKLIAETKGKLIAPIVNTSVLRSMSKAKYHEIPIGHYGLVLEDYAQFTSPIRRYPDLTIHRILGELSKGTPTEKIEKKYSDFVVKASRQSTQTELVAMKLERTCDDIYKAEYMKQHVGEEYDAIISSIAHHGLYVSLENSVEGLIKAENMPVGEYEYDEMMEYRNVLDGKKYRIGDAIHVTCISVDVSAGNIDFAAGNAINV